MDINILDKEKISLARDILDINDITIFYEVKRRLTGILYTNDNTDNTEKVLKAVSGKWRDSRDADAMVDDIYKSRTSKGEDELINILNS